jgi:hypothetical protein
MGGEIRSVVYRSIENNRPSRQPIHVTEPSAHTQPEHRSDRPLGNVGAAVRQALTDGPNLSRISIAQDAIKCAHFIGVSL